MLCSWGILGTASGAMGRSGFWQGCTVLLPSFVSTLLTLGAAAVLLLDTAASAATVWHVKRRVKQKDAEKLQQLNSRLASATARLGSRIEARVARRMERPIP